MEYVYKGLVECHQIRLRSVSGPRKPNEINRFSLMFIVYIKRIDDWYVCMGVDGWWIQWGNGTGIHMINNTHPINIQIYKNPTGKYKSTSIHTHNPCTDVHMAIITRCVCSEKENIFKTWWYLGWNV